MLGALDVPPAPFPRSVGLPLRSFRFEFVSPALQAMKIQIVQPVHPIALCENMSAPLVLLVRGLPTSSRHDAAGGRGLRISGPGPAKSRKKVRALARCPRQAERRLTRLATWQRSRQRSQKKRRYPSMRVFFGGRTHAARLTAAHRGIVRRRNVSQNQL
jgi:hypothetical protein